MFKKTLFVVTGSLVAMSAFSADMANVKKSIPLEDGVGDEVMRVESLLKEHSGSGN